ncbi:MAG: 2-C-methyl-D-erythritol 4-phosphate cytidylyltransferase [Pirellulales bacterium]
MSKFAVILAAAGRSSRFRDQHFKKPFAPLAGRAVWLHSADFFLNRADVGQLLVVVAAEDREEFASRFGANVAILGIDVVQGGAERSDSVRAALKHVRDDIQYVAVHDAARPCLAEPWIDQLFETTVKTGAAILAVPVSDTLKRSADGQTVTETVSRQSLWQAQTPQAFRKDWLIDAYSRLKGPVTDDAQAIEQAGHPVQLVMGSPLNMKITTRGDMKFAEQALKVLPHGKLDGPLHPFADGDKWR